MPGIEPPVVSPRTLADALVLMATAPHRPVAGGTDLMVQLAADASEPPERIIDLWQLDELRRIRLEPDELIVGALTTHMDLRRASLVRERLPALAEAAATVGAIQIQHRGTIGGNICNASPAGDLLPVLLAADAAFVLGSTRGEREVPADAFWVAYRSTALAPDELLLRIRVPLPRDRRIRFWKVGTRRAQAISKVVLALAYRVDGDAWRDVRVAVGSVAPTPVRARATEAILEGGLPDASLAERAVAALTNELRPIDDVRSTADYRRTVSGRVLYQLLREERGW
jgi:CO/xanthine dehydrogenase FAD-binding subunit